jgi:hypothetical protein
MLRHIVVGMHILGGLLLGGAVRAEAPRLEDPWDLIAHRSDGGALGALAEALSNPQMLGRITPVTLHAIVGLDPGARARVERLLAQRLGEASLPPGHKVYLTWLLAELGDLSPTVARSAGAFLAAEVGRPSLLRKRTRHATILNRVLVALPPAEARALVTPVVESLIDQVRQTEDADLLADQVPALLSLAGSVRAESWRFVASSMRRAMARETRNVPGLGGLFVRVVAEMETAAAVLAARETVPILLATLPRIRDAEVLPLADWLATLAVYLSDEEVARLGATASPWVATCSLDTIRLATLGNDRMTVARLRTRMQRLVSRWADEDAARVVATLDSRQVENLRQKVAPRAAGQPTRAEAEGLRTGFLALVKMQYVEYSLLRVQERSRGVLDPLILPVLHRWNLRAVENHAWETADRLSRIAEVLDPEDAVTILLSALCEYPLVWDHARLVVPLGDALLTSLERLEPARCREHLHHASPVLVKFAESAPVLFESVRAPQVRLDDFLDRVGNVVKQAGAGELTEFRTRLVRFVLDHPGEGRSTAARLQAFLDPTVPETRSRGIASGVASILGSTGTVWSCPAMMTAGREPLPGNFCVDLLKQPSCVGASRRVVLDALEVRYGERFADPWAFVQFATDRKLGLDLSSPPQLTPAGP